MTDVILPIDPVARQTLGAMVTERLRELVIRGRFEPGTQLSESDLADRFGVSRGPIREALQHLLQEGLLRRDPKRGISIPVMRDEDFADLLVAREAIEAAAMRVIIRGDVTAITRELRETVRLMGDAVERGDWTRVAELDLAFRTRMVAAAQSPRLTRIYSWIMDETRACFNMTARYPGRDDLVAAHAEHAGLLERRDVAGVLGALEAQFTEAVRTLSSHRPLSDRGAETRPPTAQEGRA